MDLQLLNLLLRNQILMKREMLKNGMVLVSGSESSLKFHLHKLMG
jgi:hypothetical protein